MEERLEQERLKKLEQLREKGIDPHGRKIENVQPVESVLAEFAEEKMARVAGRMTALRNFGKAAFADLRDSTGRLQIYFKKDHIGDEGFELFQLIDLGDLIAVEGKLGKTRTGEPTLFVEKLWLLSKSLLPMPEKWHGLTDVEVRYRQRYVDLISNPEVMQTFKRRVKIISEIRRFLDARGFLEVETPMMQSIPGGAAARPFITHHNTLDMDLYLRISPELFLKRLLVGGMERVYEINRNFRNEGLSTRHNPEFTMMEIYQAYADYNDMMELTEELITSLVQSVHGGTEIEFNGVKLNFARPWARRRWNDLLKEHAGVGIEDEAALRRRAADLSLNPEGDPAVVANRIFEECVEGKLVQPTFVLDYPKALCPLTKQCPDDPRFAARFEMYICSMECANAYTELNDPLDQEKRFREQLEEEAGQVRTVDEDFVRALKYGMPPAGGLGIGIDRIVMVLTNSPSIRDVILFPVMRTAAE